MPKKYDHLDKAQLVALLEERDKEKRLGLVWERDPALVGKDTSVNKQFVTLDLLPEVSSGTAPYRNLIIEGDNYDALRLLRMTHAKRVKCIYIDPPYNTGNRDFLYNDRFIDKTDGWRHSKWIEFMHRRLLLAKDLLREDGVIFVSIDDNELFHLGMLMNQVFGEENFVANCIWQKRYSRENRETIGDAHEYLLVYAQKKEQFKETRGRIPLTQKQYALYKNPDEDNRGPWQSVSLTAQGYRKNQMYCITAPSGKKHLPPDGRCWKLIEFEFNKLISDNRIYFGKDGDGVPRRKYFLSEAEGLVPWTWWNHEEVGHTDEAKKEIRAIFGTQTAFDTPKPVRLIERILRIATSPSDIIVDFFAGSGTTGHAVLKLNAEDGGKRQFILVSSTEATAEEPEKNLCRDVCAKRMKRVCEGYGEVAGLGDGFAYLRIEKMEAGRLLRRLQHQQVWLTLQLMHLDSVDPKPPTGPVWAAGEEEERIFYLTQTNQKTWEALEKARAGQRNGIIYTWQPEMVKHHARGAEVRPIPKFLLQRLGIQP